MEIVDYEVVEARVPESLDSGSVNVRQVPHLLQMRLYWWVQGLEVFLQALVDFSVEKWYNRRVLKEV